MLGFTLVRQPKAAPTTSAKPKKRRPAASSPTVTGVAIKLGLAAAGSTLDKGTVVPYVDQTVESLATRLEGVVRPNGSVGNHYVNAYGVAEADLDAAQAALAWLLAKGQRPKGSPKPKASVPEPQPALEGELALLKAQMALLLAGGQPPVAEGHTMVEAPKEPEIAAELAFGQVIAIGNDLYEVAEAKNGKPFLRIFG